jgi:hypothetical protein
MGHIWIPNARESWEEYSLNIAKQVCTKMLSKSNVFSENFSLGGTTKDHLAKITQKLDSILKIKFRLLIHWFI